MLKRLRVPDEVAVRVPAATMHAAVVDYFEHFGMPQEDARQAADTLLWADLHGTDSHGVSNMMPVYRRGFESGSINPRPQSSIVREAAATATVDSDLGLGLAVGPRFMELAMDKAAQCGIGAVAVRNGQHFGAAGYHAAMALERDMVGVAMTVGGLAVPPTRGSVPMLGLNALAIAAPADKEPPFIFDGTLASVAGNKIRLAQRLGVHLGMGWIADGGGTPIMEQVLVPEQYSIVPLGGVEEIGSHKGYGLLMAIDILAGVLSGTGGLPLHRGAISHHFLAYRIDAFTDVTEFKQDMDEFLCALCETPPAPGEERVIYPGLAKHETRQEREERGIPYHPDVVAWFRQQAEELGLPQRFE